MNPTPSYYAQQLEQINATVALPAYQYVQIRQSRALMEQSLAEDLNLERMAAAAAMSRFHFIRIFQRVYGLTPRQYLRDLRIHRAKTLLQSGLPVTTVCYEVGYSSLPTFSRAFKRGTGLSPQAYQRQSRNRE
jgi:AraC-like DNA-binding protein